jgi:hypothetical protein
VQRASNLILVLQEAFPFLQLELYFIYTGTAHTIDQTNKEDIKRVFTHTRDKAKGRKRSQGRNVR